MVMLLTSVLNSAENAHVNDNWCGDQFSGNFLTDTLIPLLWACVPAALLIFCAIIWLNPR